MRMKDLFGNEIKKQRRRTRFQTGLAKALIEQFFPSGVAETDWSRINRILTALEEKGATPDIFFAKVRSAKSQWSMVTPESIVKHWDQLKSGPLVDWMEFGE
jgi:hypothetical protein